VIFEAIYLLEGNDLCAGIYLYVEVKWIFFSLAISMGRSSLFFSVEVISSLYVFVEAILNLFFLVEEILCLDVF
jgi:hypothetical protein